MHWPSRADILHAKHTTKVPAPLSHLLNVSIMLAIKRRPPKITAGGHCAKRRKANIREDSRKDDIQDDNHRSEEDWAANRFNASTLKVVRQVNKWVIQKRKFDGPGATLRKLAEMTSATSSGLPSASFARLRHATSLLGHLHQRVRSLSRLENLSRMQTRTCATTGRARKFRKVGIMLIKLLNRIGLILTYASYLVRCIRSSKLRVHQKLQRLTVLNYTKWSMVLSIPQAQV